MIDLHEQGEPFQMTGDTEESNIMLLENFR